MVIAIRKLRYQLKMVVKQLLVLDFLCKIDLTSIEAKISLVSKVSSIMDHRAFRKESGR